MFNPTFASFKNSRQAYQSSVLGESSLNIQPRTFQDAKNANSTMIGLSRVTQATYDGPYTSNCGTAVKRNVISFNMKKSSSQLNVLGIEEGKVERLSKHKPANVLTAKKNYVQVERTSRDRKTSRPIITGPTLLKNKSFIYTVNTQGKENPRLLQHRPSHDVLRSHSKLKSSDSIGSYDRHSEQVNQSISSSNGQVESFSCFNTSRIQTSSNLKDSCGSSYFGEMALNFSRKTNQSVYKGKFGNAAEDTTCYGDISSLCSMAKQLKSSYGSEIDDQKSISNDNSLSLSNKFQNYRKARPMPNAKNFSIQEFQIIQEIGQGKYGRVLMVQHRATQFICALKVVSKSKIKQQGIEQAFIRQIKIQMYLDHPNIVKLFGFFHDSDNIYLIMECCVQGHLLKLIKQQKTFTEKDILDIITNVFEAVSFLHCHGIIHRDLKPENIVIQNNMYKICDFGWAAYAKGDTRTTFCGTPLYVCPEVLKGSEYDEKADIWGLGVLTYELSYGRVPFPIWSQADMLKIVKDPVYFPAWTSVSEKMQNLIKSMLNKDPTKRPSLNEILSGSLISEYVSTRPSLKSELEVLF